MYEWKCIKNCSFVLLGDAQKDYQEEDLSKRGKRDAEKYIFFILLASALQNDPEKGDGIDAERYMRRDI